MVRTRRQPIRGDTSPKAQPPKAPKKPKDADYEEYQRWIKSPQFRSLRERMLERDGHRCQFCGREASERISLQAHHRSYAHVGLGNDEELGDLITACQICHHAIHNAKGNLGRFKDKRHIHQNLRANPGWNH